MIFSIGDHIEQIKAGTKTQTRRVVKLNPLRAPIYKWLQDYAIQPGRGMKAIPEGRIQITKVTNERRGKPISDADALAEGGYKAGEYELLFQKMYPDWKYRWVYHFKYIQSSSGSAKK